LKFLGGFFNWSAVTKAITRCADHLSSNPVVGKSFVLVYFGLLFCLVFNRMAPRKTGIDMLVAESRERNYVSKGRRIAHSASKEPENSARIVTGKSGSQGVESNSVDLAREEKPLNELSIEEQILRLIGEISDEECDSSSISNRTIPVASKNSSVSRKRRFSELVGETSKDDDNLPSKFVKVSRESAVRVNGVKASAVKKNRKERFLELFGEASDDDEFLSSNYVRGASKPKKESGVAREWRLIPIDVDARHRRHQKLTGPSGASYTSFFSVGPFQLKDFETEWGSFLGREVSGGISDYRPSIAGNVSNWI